MTAKFVMSGMQKERKKEKTKNCKKLKQKVKIK